MGGGGRGGGGKKLWMYMINVYYTRILYMPFKGCTLYCTVCMHICYSLSHCLTHDVLCWGETGIFLTINTVLKYAFIIQNKTNTWYTEI